MTAQLHHGNCLDVLATMPDASIDAVITDPPYGIGFMGKQWDTGKAFVERRAAKQNRFDHVGGNHNPANSIDQHRTYLRENTLYGQWCTAWAIECLRVLKPGGHLLAFGGTRTYHRLTSGIEDAGFEIRDSITWLYGSGFPKSMDVSKAIDKAAGAEREVVGLSSHSSLRAASSYQADSTAHGYVGRSEGERQITAPVTNQAKQWSGWGTALKPASEPIVVARKPLSGTVVNNVLTHGTGALNIDACRIPTDEVKAKDHLQKAHDEFGTFIENGGRSRSFGSGANHQSGRWPANVVLSHAEECADQCGDSACPVVELDQQSGTAKSSAHPRHNSALAGDIYGTKTAHIPSGHADTGGASRFFPTFRYQTKAPSRERPKVDGVSHPTVKPLELMRWLVKLVVPQGALILDPFAGSGTTLEAAVLEGMNVIGVEADTNYLPLIEHRMQRVGCPLTLLKDPA